MQVMQSNKWTFSLTSLVVILALAFIAPVVMAGEFDIAGLSVVDVSHAGDAQLEYSPGTSVADGDDQRLFVFINVGKQVLTSEVAKKVKLYAYDKDGIWLATLDGNVAPGTASDAHIVTPDGNNADPANVFTNFAVMQNPMYNDNQHLIIKFTVTSSTNPTATAAAGVAVHRVVVKVAAGIPTQDPLNADTSKAKDLTFYLVGPEYGTDYAADPPKLTGTAPTVSSIVRHGDPVVKPTGPFQVIITLSEKPKEFNKDYLEVGEGSVTSFVELAAIDDDDSDPEGTAAAGNTQGTGRDNMLYRYLATIQPNKGNKTVSIKVKSFQDLVAHTINRDPVENKYTRPNDVSLVEGTDKLTVPTAIDADPAADKTAGFEVNVPHGEAAMIPANGYLLLAKNKDGSGIAYSHEKDHENKAAHQTPAQLLFNTRAAGLPNLETFLANGGTIDLTTTTDAAMGSVVISEIMWGSDAARDNSTESQYIELHNTTASAIAIGDKNWKLKFYGANEVLPTAGYIDRVGTRTLNPDGSTLVFWSISDKGASGRTNNPGTGAAIVPTVVTSPLVSMQRGMMADGTFADGTMASSWGRSMPPALNFKTGIEGAYIGTPGAAPTTTFTPAVPPTQPEPTLPPVIPPATAADIGITEIMADSGSGRFPQWIELTNKASGEVSLDGWMLNITNDPTDANVVGSSLVIDLSGNTLGVSAHPGNMGKGQSLLIIAFSGRGSGNLSNVAIVDASSADQLAQTGRYLLLSETAFKLVLMPPQDSGITVYGDMAGNLENGAATWTLPATEGMRSSLIRMEMDAKKMPTMGTSADGWRLASMTDLASGQITWYGSDDDAATPGYDAGGPLPVELSMFYPKRDQLTGQVVITWETQSELNNAGFFIKRSQQRDGKFVVINPTMIAGAGTTSEKQSYTYTDTSAKPNVVYYYQIEDVSLDGQRQTLTLGTRLRGHIGAAGKATTTWGELKKVQE